MATAMRDGAAQLSVSDSGTGLGHCDILNLSLGPVDLTLLGLQVRLNNCDDPAGPVTVDVFAVPGPGNLLGNLLCGLSGLLDNNANIAAVPEPATWALMILGFGLLGTALRRRQLWAAVPV